jgi:hypothetical protein
MKVFVTFSLGSWLYQAKHKAIAALLLVRDPGQT